MTDPNEREHELALHAFVAADATDRLSMANSVAKLLAAYREELTGPGPTGPRLGVKLLRPGARMPEYAHEGDAGMDVFACLDAPLAIRPGQTVKVPLGFAMDIPAGYHIDCRGKSGNDSRGRFTVRLGLVDGNFRGELQAIVYAPPYLDDYGAPMSGLGYGITISPGDKVAQLVLRKTEHLPLEQVSELSETARGEAGFGSTGSR